MTNTSNTYLEFKRADWMAQAACKGKPVAMFFPERDNKGGLSHLRELCASCPVRQLCADVAIADPMTKGFWGGLSERQRRNMRRGVVTVGRVRKPAACGTVAGARRHYRDGETLCEGCLEAHNAASRATKARSRERQSAARRALRGVA